MRQKNKRIWKVKPTGSTEGWSPEAKKMLAKVQNAKHFKNKKQQNKNIKILKKVNPEMAFEIDQHFKKDAMAEFDNLLGEINKEDLLNEINKERSFAKFYDLNPEKENRVLSIDKQINRLKGTK